MVLTYAKSDCRTYRQVGEWMREVMRWYRASGDGGVIVYCASYHIIVSSHHSERLQIYIIKYSNYALTSNNVHIYQVYSTPSISTLTESKYSLKCCANRQHFNQVTCRIDLHSTLRVILCCLKCYFIYLSCYKKIRLISRLIQIWSELASVPWNRMRMIRRDIIS